MSVIDVAAYAHSPVHKAIILKDHNGLKEILSGLPKLLNSYEIETEAESIAEEEKAAKVAAVVNRRDVPNGDTPLHLAAKLGDFVASEMLMRAGANSSLKNKNGWTAKREAVINKQEKIAKMMIELSWTDYADKWHRRLPRYVGILRRMRDFYMEISFHFESSIIPFISRIAPSDTYKIWKKGGNMRVDLTLAGFDGMKFKRSDQSLLFLGDGLASGKKLPDSLCRLAHKKKEVIFGAAEKPTERDIKQKLAEKSRAKIVTVGIDVSKALLCPQLTWRRKEKKEMVGPWKAKVYEMHNVILSVKSKSIPGAQPEPELTLNESKKDDNERIEDILTEEERKQLEAAMNASEEEWHRDKVKKEKKKRSGGHREKEHHKGKKSTKASSPDATSSSSSQKDDENGENEYKKGMMPVLWLSPNFPLKIEELLPLLDIIAEKVKATRRLRELLTTKLPKETFPVRVAIPVVSTVRVLITFSKFEELRHADEFESAPSSPTGEEDEDEDQAEEESSSSWFQWMKAPSFKSSSSAAESSSKIHDSEDLFAIPSDYTWPDFYTKYCETERNRKTKAQNSTHENPTKCVPS